MTFVKRTRASTYDLLRYTRLNYYLLLLLLLLLLYAVYTSECLRLQIN